LEAFVTTSLTPPDRPWRRRLAYLATVLLTAVATVGVLALLINIRERKREAEEHFVKLVELDEDTVDPQVWAVNFPREYDTYKRTADGTLHGGSEALPPSRLEADPRLKRIYAGYAFSVDFRERRGHAYMLLDQEQTERVKQFKQPGACLHCHCSILPAYRQAGDGDVMKGFEKVCAMPYGRAHELAARPEGKKLITHPVSCVDCHDPRTAQLRVTRPGFLNGIKELAKSDAEVPHLPSVQRWRAGNRREDYDPNRDATRQELRSFVCGQCHVEYYFKGEGKLLTYPWHKGLKADQIESYYDETGFTDWTHAETKAKVLKAQHPEFEMWSQGIHARSGVACADCHMPYVRQGAVKVSDHWVRSPMLNVERACQTCHRFPEGEMRARVAAIQERTKSLLDRAENALMEMMDTLKAGGVPPDRLEEAQRLHRRAQWRVDFVVSENSRGFHAPQEAARLLGEAIDFARQAQLRVLEGRKP
jgi:nitrite reductase (cytochrome c-552)